ncbi:MAG: hypothetical protein RLZZ361_240 [Cyanobacteriota bacterium]|jgi:hypothetical protein
MASMNEININNNINPYNSFANQQSTGQIGINPAVRYSGDPAELMDIKSGTASQRDLTPMIKLVASRMGVSEMVASRLIRKLLSSGQLGSISDMKNFLVQYLQSNQENDIKKSSLFDELRARSASANTEKQLESAFRPIIKEMNDKFIQTQDQTTRTAKALFFSRDGAQGVGASLPIPVTPLVTSPKEFASWLVNNKSAFISMRANPAVTNLLIALQNPQIQQSPIMIAEIAKLLAQLIKLKQGSKVSEFSDSEKMDEERNKEYNLAASDHEHHVVSNIRETIENVAITPLRDFLIEAERFAEEEVANLWSLTLKKEKELEKKVKQGINKLRKQKNNN